MKHVCLECDSTFIISDEEICPICGSEDILDLPEEIDDSPGHHEGDFGGYRSIYDRED